MGENVAVKLNEMHKKLGLNVGKAFRVLNFLGQHFSYKLNI